MKIECFRQKNRITNLRLLLKRIYIKRKLLKYLYDFKLKYYKLCYKALTIKNLV